MRSHVTPRYIYDRLKYMWYERRHPEEPWLVPQAIDALRTMLLPDDDGIEWGSGRSTRWFAKRLRRLISVEANAEWHGIVTQQLASAGVTNVDYRLRVLADESDTESAYTRAADDVPDGTLGFALVDGAARGLCALAAIDKLKPGGVLVVDNLHLYLDYPTRAPKSLYGKGPMNGNWATFLERTTGWRHVVYSNGVTDTGLWIKTCPLRPA